MKKLFILTAVFSAMFLMMSCGGGSGLTGDGEKTHQMIEYSLKLESNPEFTASVICAFGRAVVRMAKEGMTGCKTVFDVAPAYLSPLSADEIRAHLL